MATKMEKDDVLESKPAKKKFANDDYIDCRSITSGELILIGARTKELYSWADYGDVVGVMYQDLIYDVRSTRDGYSMYPRFIVEDDEFIAQNPKLKDLYEKQYTTSDIKQIFRMSDVEMKKVIPTLPQGIQASVKNMAATMIANGQLDSVKKIRVLDELFDTEMLQTLSEN